MRNIFFSGVLLFLLASCDNNSATFVNSETTIGEPSISEFLEDTTKTLVVELPVYIDSTDILIHPIGWNEVGVSKGSRNAFSISKSKSSGYDNYFWISFDGKNQLSGSMTNLIFESIATGQQRVLTDKMLNIKSVTYLREIARKTGKQLLLYNVLEKYYKKDTEKGALFFEACYISNLDGTNFTKLTKDYHTLNDTDVMLANNRFYFRTLEDVDRDGRFTIKNKYHYYYVDLTTDEIEAVEYFPINLMNLE